MYGENNANGLPHFVLSCVTVGVNLNELTARISLSRSKTFKTTQLTARVSSNWSCDDRLSYPNVRCTQEIVWCNARLSSVGEFPPDQTASNYRQIACVIDKCWTADHMTNNLEIVEQLQLFYKW